MVRFKGFDDGWTTHTLSSVTNIYDGTHQTPKYTSSGVMFLSAENIKSLQSNKFITEDSFAKEFKIYPVKGDVLMTRIGDVGTANVVENNAPKAYYVTLALLKQKELDPYFLKASIASPFVQQDIWYRTLHIAFPKKINMNEIAKVVINTPSLHAEQSKIGSYFQHIDKLIALHQAKYDKLTVLKKAMLEKMFPKEGADVPEIRFKGFLGAWEDRRFGECVLIQRGGSPRPIENFITSDENGINWIKIGDVSKSSRYITKTKEKIIHTGEKLSRKVYKGDLILSNSMSFGRPYIMAIDGCIHDGWLLIRDEKKLFDLEYLLQLLSSNYMLEQYRALASGGVVINLNSELVQSTIIYLPSKDEQIKIGSYFQNLDKLISLQQQELTKLKNLKKACLDKMFV